MIRTEKNWGQRNGRKELVEKTAAGDWRACCPWCEEVFEAVSRGDALEVVADHILEEHA